MFTTVNGQRLQDVDTFTNYGSTLSRPVHIDDEVNARIVKSVLETSGKCLGSKRDQAKH